jgi:hypothetical protein
LCDEASLPPGTNPFVRQTVWKAARSRPRRLAGRILVISLVLVGSRLIFQLLRGRMDPFELLGSGISVVVVAVLLVLYSWFAGRRNDRRAIDACLSIEVCPGCGNALAGLAVEDDGCRICPECGAAWRLPA